MNLFKFRCRNGRNKMLITHNLGTDYLYSSQWLPIVATQPHQTVATEKEKLLMSGNRVLPVLTLRAVGGGMEKFVTNNPPGATSYASIVPTAETEGEKNRI
ncbi:hypothetical protein TNIN_167151 [Trichonephila inaurata madagascariensis]|uniref:Uncharacterized protein n=1 Tax=Trichonephila inaurata madagascariensis TaxID=2747483 RepID=A0A8X7BR87_9ARAC|nr:hypothetical protein TNIN_167151 [Trichonephila inaurata madagascariensis]